MKMLYFVVLMMVVLGVVVCVFIIVGLYYMMDVWLVDGKFVWCVVN